MSKIFVTSLMLPHGVKCKFKVFKVNACMWDFSNENLFTIYIYRVAPTVYKGALSVNIGNQVQHENLISQAIFELKQFYNSK